MALPQKPCSKGGLDRQDSLQLMMSRLDELAAPVLPRWVRPEFTQTRRALPAAAAREDVKQVKHQSRGSHLSYTSSLQMIELELDMLAASSPVPKRSKSHHHRVHFSPNVEVMEYETLEEESDDETIDKLGAGMAQEAFETSRSLVRSVPRDSLLQPWHALDADANGPRHHTRDSLMQFQHALADEHAAGEMSTTSRSRDSLVQLGDALQAHFNMDEVGDDETNDNQEESPRNSHLELRAGIAQQAFETNRPLVRSVPRDSLLQLWHALDAHANVPSSIQPGR